MKKLQKKIQKIRNEFSICRNPSFGESDDTHGEVGSGRKERKKVPQKDMNVDVHISNRETKK